MGRDDAPSAAFQKPGVPLTIRRGRSFPRASGFIPIWVPSLNFDENDDSLRAMSLVGILTLIAISNRLGAAKSAFLKAKVCIMITRPKKWIREIGGAMSWAAASTALEIGDIRVEEWRMTLVPFRQTVDIAPPSVTKTSCETELKEGTPDWRGPFLLPGPDWAFRGLHVETLEAVLADDPSVRLEIGRDFALDPDWASVAALPFGRSPAGTKVRFSYGYGLSRIDLLAQSPDGRAVWIQGIEHKSQPRLPVPPPGYTPLLSVVLPNYARALTPDMICILDPSYDGVPPIARAEHVAGLRAKLESDAPVTMIFFGDSITVQPAADFLDGKGNYVDQFAAWLRERYPQREVVVTGRNETAESRTRRTVVVKAGVGGDDIAGGGRRLESDVLSRRPDLLVVMFGINDENRSASGGNVVPPPVFRANLTYIVKAVRSMGAAVIVMTPGMKNPYWSATTGNIAEYAEAARAVAQEQGVCLVDNYRAWEQIRKRGYTPMVLLGNCINHPVDIAHDQMFRGLRAALETSVGAAFPQQ